MNIVALCVWGVLALVSIILLAGSIFTVKQQTVKIIERFGKFTRVSKPGLSFKIPLIERIVAVMSLKIQQLNVDVETKTKDNVFVKIKIAVQLKVIEGKEYDAHYKLTSIRDQISSYVFDIVRAQVPSLNLDDVFIKKDDISQAVCNELKQIMDDFGYDIMKALVTDIDPDEKVKSAMNKINEAQRLRIAANEQGEADKILVIKKAEAESESKRLQGEGIAKQRTAIINGLKESVESFAAATKSNPNEVMNLVLVTQYFDAICKIGADSKNTVLMIPHSPEGMTSVFDQMVKASTASKSL